MFLDRAYFKRGFASASQYRQALIRQLMQLAFALSCMVWMQTPAQAQTDVAATLMDAVKSLPIPGIKDAVNAAVRQASGPANGAGYDLSVNGAKAVLYVLGTAPRMSVVLMINGTTAIPGVFNNTAWNRLGGATLVDPIFSFSTMDYELPTSNLPAALKTSMASSYFNAPSLQFRAGFQIAARFQAGGVFKTVLEKGLGLPESNFVIRAGVALPVPTDPQGQAGLAVTLLSDIKNVANSIKDLPEFYVELQTSPGTKFSAPMGMSAFSLSDATFYFNNQGVVGYTGNLIMNTIDKKFAVSFQTPVSPTGAMDFLDFQFGMAARDFTLADYARLVISMNTASVAGGGFLKDTSAFQNYLTQLLQPLSVVKVYNPKMLADYKYGDPTRPFPTSEAFNLLVLGPLATTEDASGKAVMGPMFKAMGQARIMGQEVGNLYMYAGPNGLRVNSTAQMSLKLGPLGKQSVSMNGTVDISKERQVIKFNGNVLGRVMEMSLTPTQLMINSPATCATPFEISANVEIKSDMNVATILDGLPGVNVNPAQLSGCVGAELKQALQWVGTTGKSLGGYSANDAGVALKNITDAEARAAAEAYRIAKDQAREKIEQANHESAKAFKSAGNFAKKIFGRKKKKRPEPQTEEKFAGSVFDFDYYYDANPDLVRAGVDLVEHWRNIGYHEGRRGSLEFDPAYYYANNPNAVKEANKGGRDAFTRHWLNQGIEQGRQGSAECSIRAYEARYPDLLKLKWSWERLFDHWMESGKDAGRTCAP